jgi:hypothetical protein
LPSRTPRPTDGSPNNRSSFRSALAARRRSLPWSDRSILLASLVIVLFLSPLWLDPVTIGEVIGEPSRSLPAPQAPTFGMARPATGPTTNPADIAVLARDSFARSVAGGWGSAEVGGAYVASGAGQLGVTNGLGVASLSPDQRGQVLLPAAASRDVVFEYTVDLDHAQRTGETVVYAILRSSGETSAYRLAIHFAPTVVYAGIDKLVDGAVVSLGSDVAVTGQAPGNAIPPALRLRVEASGSDPTTLRLRAWPAAEPEPNEWHVSVIDWTGQLQGSGAIGIGWQTDARETAPVVLHFSVLSAWVAGEGVK